MSNLPSDEALLPPEDCIFYDSFQRNIVDFVNASGKEVQLPIDLLRCWFVSLNDGTHLHIYAETMSKENYSCDQCRIIGMDKCSIIPSTRSREILTI